jgi:hypothetical protein
LQFVDAVPIGERRRHFDLAGRPSPKHLRAFWIGNGELDPQQRHRRSDRVSARSRVAEKRSGHDRVVEAGRIRLGKAEPAAARRD